MDYKVEEINILTRLKDLDLTLPEKLSFFPENIESVNQKEEFVFTDSYA